MSTKAVLAGLVERNVSQLYTSIKTQVLSLANSNPVAKVFVEAQLKANEHTWLTELGKQCDLVVEAACPNDAIDLNDAIQNANDLINAKVSDFLATKFGIPRDTIAILIENILAR